MKPSQECRPCSRRSWWPQCYCPARRDGSPNAVKKVDSMKRSSLVKGELNDEVQPIEGGFDVVAVEDLPVE